MQKMFKSFGSLLFASLFSLAAFGDSTNKRLDIYWVDVEGGAATLIVTPTGESVLIDAGNPGDRDPKRIFEVASKIAGLKKIDHLVTTHYHIDHFGGAAQLSAMIPIGNVYNNGEHYAGREAPPKEYLEFKADKRITLNAGDEIPLVQAASATLPIHIKCICAHQEVIPAPAGAPENPLAVDAKHKAKDLSDNANSIVNVLSFGDFRFFVAGDLTWNVELKLVSPVNLVGTVDVYQAGHHGLDQSNHPALVKSLAPTVAVINNGPKKGCEPECFRTISGLDSIKGIFQLHRNVRPDGKEINVKDASHIANEPETDQCEGNYVKLSVDPAAKTYTVSIPATKLEQTFDVRKH